MVMVYTGVVQCFPSFPVFCDVRCIIYNPIDRTFVLFPFLFDSLKVFPFFPFPSFFLKLCFCKRLYSNKFLSLSCEVIRYIRILRTQKTFCVLLYTGTHRNTKKTLTVLGYSTQYTSVLIFIYLFIFMSRYCIY